MAKKTTLTTIYDQEFYDEQKEKSFLSAKRIVPEILKHVNVNSVVDVGCRIGTFLSVFKQLGINDICGIDGAYVQNDQLLISKDNFIAHDLNIPINLKRKFDLVVSLEVAEHLDETSADVLINSLVSLGAVVLFSAAIPYQGGTHHVNLQWQSYWAEKFIKRGYWPVDILRKRVWDDSNVCFWYAQNTILYVHKDTLDNKSTQSLINNINDVQKLDLVHPKMYLYLADALQDPNAVKVNPRITLKDWFLMFPGLLRKSLQSRFKKVFKQ